MGEDRGRGTGYEVGEAREAVGVVRGTGDDVVPSSITELLSLLLWGFEEEEVAVNVPYELTTSDEGLAVAASRGRDVVIVVMGRVATSAKDVEGAVGSSKGEEGSVPRGRGVGDLLTCRTTVGEGYGGGPVVLAAAAAAMVGYLKLPAPKAHASPKRDSCALRGRRRGLLHATGPRGGGGRAPVVLKGRGQHEP